VRIGSRASALIWCAALCLGGRGALGCQSQLLTLGELPVETDGGSGGDITFGGGPGDTSGRGGVSGVGGSSSGLGGMTEPGSGGGATSGEGGANTSGEGGAGADTAGASGAGAGGARGTIRIIDVSPIAELASDYSEENPTLTADLLHIYFTSNREDSADVWTASRSSATGTFGEATQVDEINTDGHETSPAISLDGLTLWVGQERDEGLGANDIWSITRSDMQSSWSGPINVAELNSSADDIPRPPGFGSRVMPLASRRNQDGLYHTYLAERAFPNGTFGPPELISELVFDDRSTVDGFLSSDGLSLFYASSAEDDESDLYLAVRPSPTEPFGEPIPLVDVNSLSDVRDPWLSPDGTTLYFTSSGDGDLDLFTAQVIWE
jgi:hypothetical protein